MMARWVTRAWRRRAGRGPARPAPVLNLAHLSLALASLLAWIGYLATGVTGLAWAGCTLLLPVAGLGMALVFRAPAATPATARAVTPAVTRAAGPGVLTVAAHITAASLTILLAVLAAIGAG
jgi:hypothetical protein